MSFRGTIHRVRAGETLSHLALRYGFGGDWRPLWNFNSRVRTNLTGDPHSIPVGARVDVPRTAAEYDEALARLAALELELAELVAQELKTLQAGYGQIRDLHEKLDLAWDIATIPLGARRIIARARLKLGTRYAEIVEDKQVLKALADLATSVLPIPEDSPEGIGARAAKDAVTDNAIFLFHLGEVRPSKLTSSGGKSVAKQLTKLAVTETVRTRTSGSESSVLVDVTTIVCDLLLMSVPAFSNLFNLGVWALTGETPEDIYVRGRASAHKEYRRSLDVVNRTRARITTERNRVGL